MDQQLIRQEIETLYSMALSVRKQLQDLAGRLNGVGLALDRLGATAEDRKENAEDERSAGLGPA